jgi:hypothetical protein
MEHRKRKKLGPRYFAYENVYLVRAKSSAEARTKGETVGRAEAVDDDSLRWNGSPARYAFGGVRKVVSCAAATKRPGDGLVRVFRDGDEATYSGFIVQDAAALRKLVRGKPVALVYEE